MFPWASAFSPFLFILKVLLRKERTVEAIESEKWSQTCILCPWEILSSCVRYVYSGFKLAETPRSGTEEGKERSKRPPLALKYNPRKSKIESTRIRSSDTHVSILKVRIQGIWQTFLKTIMLRIWIVGHEIGTGKPARQRINSPLGYGRAQWVSIWRGTSMKDQISSCQVLTWNHRRGHCATWWKWRVGWLHINSRVLS